MAHPVNFICVGLKCKTTCALTHFTLFDMAVFIETHLQFLENAVSQYVDSWMATWNLHCYTRQFHAAHSQDFQLYGQSYDIMVRVARTSYWSLRDRAQSIKTLLAQVNGLISEDNPAELARIARLVARMSDVPNLTIGGELPDAIEPVTPKGPGKPPVAASKVKVSDRDDATDDEEGEYRPLRRTLLPKTLFESK